jgi:hypothetical protein
LHLYPLHAFTRFDLYARAATDWELWHSNHADIFNWDLRNEKITPEIITLPGIEALDVWAVLVRDRIWDYKVGLPRGLLLRETCSVSVEVGKARRVLGYGLVTVWG